MYRSLVYVLAVAAGASIAVGKDEDLAYSPNSLDAIVGDA